MLEKLFKLKKNGTTAKVEIMAGMTTFMTMAYIIALNPNLLTDFGKEGSSLMLDADRNACFRFYRPRHRPGYDRLHADQDLHRQDQGDLSADLYHQCYFPD